MSGIEASWFGGRVRILAWPPHADARGLLHAFDFSGLPFMPKRVFTVSGAAAGTARGGHGHRSGQQLLTCIQGRIDVEMRHAGEEATVRLVPDGGLLLVGPQVWCRQTYLDEGTVLLVLASEPYSPDSYFTLGADG